MKAFINQQLLTQTVLDSGELGMLGAVIHNFPKPGEYHGAVIKGKKVSTTFHLTIDENSAAMQVDIDLAALTSQKAVSATTPCDCKDEKTEDTPHFTVNPRGQTLFYVSQGAGGFAVLVNRVNEQPILFDSRKLQNGDLFAATLLRPGTYKASNVPGGSLGEVRVTYPEPGPEPYQPPEPITIEVTDKGMIMVDGDKQKKLDRTDIKVAQGQIYRIKTPSRVRLELLKPDDGPKEKKPASILTWSKQTSPRDRPPPNRRDRRVESSKTKARAKASRAKKS